MDNLEIVTKDFEVADRDSIVISKTYFSTKEFSVREIKATIQGFDEQIARLQGQRKIWVDRLGAVNTMTSNLVLIQELTIE